MATKTNISAAHTPGPWLFRAKNESVWTQPPAGSLYKFGDHIFTFHDEDGPSDEDLNLILAAPDLFDALQGLLAVYQAMGNPRGPKEILAEAAIAKATGIAA